MGQDVVFVLVEVGAQDQVPVVAQAVEVVVDGVTGLVVDPEAAAVADGVADPRRGGAALGVRQAIDVVQ